MEENKPPTTGNGKICYIEIPALSIEESASFYHKTFGWNIRTRDNGDKSFDDGVGGVSGRWLLDRKPSKEIGMLTYIMVDDAATSLETIKANGGKMVQQIGLDAPEITARFSDPAGNIWGIYQEPG